MILWNSVSFQNYLSWKQFKICGLVIMESVFVVFSLSFLDQLIQNIACEVNKLVKKFIEDSHRVGLDDWTLTGSTSISLQFHGSFSISSQCINSFVLHNMYTELRLHLYDSLSKSRLHLLKIQYCCHVF